MSQLSAAIKLSLIAGFILFFAIVAGGCGYAKHENGRTEVFTLWKDISAKGRILPDGTKELDVTSNVNAEAIKAATEGAVSGAVKSITRP